MKKDNIDEKYVKNYLLNTLSTLNKLVSSEKFISCILEASNKIIQSISEGNCIYLAGNGGSAAHAQHFAAELVSRFNFDRNPLPAVALTTDTSILTAISNDYGYEKVFERQLQGLAKSGDVFIGFSTSGSSKNITTTFKKARELNIESIGICGEKGMKGTKPNLEISIPSSNTPLIQEMHGITSHLLCDIVEKSIFS